MNNEYIDVREFSAKGDGVTDDAPAFLEAIAKSDKTIYIAPGTYIIGETLKLKSNTHIVASPLAHIKLAPGAQKTRHDFLLTNEDCVNGNENISIIGGKWDGNSMENDRGNDLFNPAATTGALFSFMNVRNLTISGVTVKNPLCYYMRFCKADTVRIENIRFESEDCHINQDGIHFAGFCSNFIIRNLCGAESSPGDDFIAINADDCLTRQESFDMLNGPVDNILVENLYAVECHCFVRILSVTSKISNITVRNVSGCCRGNMLNMDAARYCRVPLFKPDDPAVQSGVGKIENISVSNVCVGRKQAGEEAYLLLESNCKNLSVTNFTALTPCEGESVRLKNLYNQRFELAGSSETENIRHEFKCGELMRLNPTAFASLKLDSID